MFHFLSLWKRSKAVEVKWKTIEDKVPQGDPIRNAYHEYMRSKRVLKWGVVWGVWTEFIVIADLNRHYDLIFWIVFGIDVALAIGVWWLMIRKE